MAVEQVKYNHISSAGENFANKGDKKEINSGTANQIYKDCNQGYTNITGSDLNNNKKAAAKKINSLVNEDEIEYSADESRQTGTQQIDTTNADDKGNKAAEHSVATLGTASGAVGIAAISTLIKVGQTVPEGTVHLAMSIVLMVMAGLNAASGVAAKTMPAHTNRVAEGKNSEKTNETLDYYTDQMSANMDNMMAEQEQYDALASAKLDNMINTLDEKTQIDAEIEVYMSQGNMEKVNELKEQSDAIAEGGTDDQAAMDEQMDPLKENLETYRSEASEAQGVKDSGDKVSNYLKEGTGMAAWYFVNAGLSGVAAAECLFGAMGWLNANPLPWAGIAEVASKAFLLVAAALFGVGATCFGMGGKEELDAGKAGKGMDEHLTALGDNVEGTFGFANDTSLAYASIDGECADTYQGASEGADEAVENAGKGIAVEIEPEEEPEPAVA